jgi:cytochrome c biogenesis protein CcmG/thiol:disulfide interchange protein DsbE
MPESNEPTPSSPAQPARHWGGRLARPAAFLGVFSLLGLLGWGLVRSSNGPVNSGPAPDFTLTSFDGQTVTLSDLRGQAVIINFWASWCPPCREEAAYLERTWREYQGQGVVFIGVDWVDTEKEALAYIDEFDITYFNGPDLGTRIAQAYRIRGVPETFFVDKSGRLRGVKIGPLYPPELEDKIEELLSEPVAGGGPPGDGPIPDTEPQGKQSGSFGGTASPTTPSPETGARRCCAGPSPPSTFGWPGVRRPASLGTIASLTASRIARRKLRRNPAQADPRRLESTLAR